MMENKDIIVVGIQPWDYHIGSNCKDIALEMAKKNRVLFVNPPIDRYSFFKNRKEGYIQRRKRMRRGGESFLVPYGENIWGLYPCRLTESINQLPDGKLFDFFNKVNSKRLSREIREAANILQFSNPLLFNDSSIYLGYYLKEYIQPSLYIYYIRDYLINNPYWKKHAVRVEPALIKKADLIVANSDRYAEYAYRFNRNSFMIGQGCDLSLFKETVQEAKDVNDIPRPIAGYVGALTARRLDIPLLVYLAKNLKEFSYVFVGPEDDAFKNSELHDFENVYFLGNREITTLPSYLKSFDIAINPQLLNEATMGNYPRKIDEYLAMGKPVVATATQAMNYFKEVTYLANTRENFVALLNKALSENNSQLEEKRRSVAESHSWYNNVQQIYKYAEDTINKKNKV